MPLIFLSTLSLLLSITISRPLEQDLFGPAESSILGSFNDPLNFVTAAEEVSDDWDQPNQIQDYTNPFILGSLSDSYKHIISLTDRLQRMTR